MLYINVLAITAGLLMGLAKMGTPYLMVIAGRAIMGLYCGKTEPCFYFHGILREKQGKAFIKKKKKIKSAKDRKKNKNSLKINK